MSLSPVCFLCVSTLSECMRVRVCVPGTVLLEEGVFAVQCSAVELQSGESSIVKGYRLLHRRQMLAWRAVNI